MFLDFNGMPFKSRVYDTFDYPKLDTFDIILDQIEVDQIKEVKKEEKADRNDKKQVFLK